ncbi:hypothetical protein [Williamsia phyllosphaerae]|uniref:hypothetical protein n=1 Tax=Williamsia phyllosphaerae TaxID=885042 RepID=UPI001669EE5B|nr:hypothetical protein [Williamsia phyllosphaerae]
MTSLGPSASASIRSSAIRIDRATTTATTQAATHQTAITMAQIATIVSMDPPGSSVCGVHAAVAS